MFWIIATLIAALSNALWVALSQRLVRWMPSVRFTIAFHVLLSLWLLPDFAWACGQAGWSGLSALPPWFWVAVGVVGAGQTLGVWFQGFGVRHDYYTTFAVGNTSPALVMVLAPVAVRLVPGFPGEAWGWGVLPGTALIVIGVLLLTGGGLNRTALLWGLLVSLTMAVMNLAIRWGTAGFQTADNARWIVHLFTLPSMVIGTLLLAPIALARRIPREPTAPAPRGRIWGWLVATSGLGALSTLAFNMAFLWAPSAAQPASLVRINLFIGFLLSYWLLKERGRARTRLVCGILIAAGCVLVVL